MDRATVIWASVNCCRRITHAFPVPEAGRQADPGQEVDQGAVLEAEGCGRPPPLVALLYLERRAAGQEKL
jgi:hypothetical protein